MFIPTLSELLYGDNIPARPLFLNPRKNIKNFIFLNSYSQICYELHIVYISRNVLIIFFLIYFCFIIKFKTTICVVTTSKIYIYDVLTFFFYFQDIIGNICGFLVIIVAILLLNTFKDIDIPLSDVNVWRPKRELLSRPKSITSCCDDEIDGRTNKSTYGSSDTF